MTIESIIKSSKPIAAAGLAMVLGYAAPAYTQDEADAAAKLKGKQTDEKKLGGGPAPTLAAMESRLLTRGPSDRQSNALEDAAASLRKIMASSNSIETNTATTITTLGFIKDNTSSTTQMVTVP